MIAPDTAMRLDQIKAIIDKTAAILSKTGADGLRRQEVEGAIDRCASAVFKLYETADNNAKTFQNQKEKNRMKNTTKEELITLVDQIATKANRFCQTLKNDEIDAEEYDALALKEVCAALHAALKLN